MAARSRKSKPTGRSKRKAPETGICFVISPFGGYHDRYFHAIFEPAIKKAGLTPQRADSLFRSTDILHDIWTLINQSRVILADLTGQNPNVFYELGLAHAARKPVLLVSQRLEDVPFDLRPLRVGDYAVEEPGWDRKLQSSITKGLKETLSQSTEFVLPTFLRVETGSQRTVSPDEKRFRELEYQVRALSAQAQSRQSQASLWSYEPVAAGTVRFDPESVRGYSVTIPSTVRYSSRVGEPTVILSDPPISTENLVELIGTSTAKSSAAGKLDRAPKAKATKRSTERRKNTIKRKPAGRPARSR